MDLTLVVPFFNGHQYLDRLLSSLPDNLPVIVVDDRSEPPLANINRSNVRLVRLDRKGYFTGAVNVGLKACSGDVLILNQDVYFTGTSWLNLLEDKRRIYSLIGERSGAHPAWPQRYIHGTFMFIRRDVVDALGPMNERDYPLWGSTCEYQLRACRKGFKALPLETIPDFVHQRQGNYGTSIRELLGTEGNRGRFIRTPPHLSVIITCYNYGRYLKDAVNSLVGGETSLGYMPGQTFQAFEVVIVDDGSTDNSAEIGAAMADPWRGIHFVSRPNGGSAAAMNTGIEASHTRSGHFIAPLDGDDMMETPRLEHLVRAAAENPHSAIYDNITYFSNGQRGMIQDWQNVNRKHRLDLGEYDFERILHKNTMHKGLLYPRAAWEETGGYPEIMRNGREDWAFNIALGLKGYCGFNTGYFDYLYRRELQGRSLRNTNRNWHQRFLGQLKRIYPSVYAGERPMGCCGGGRTRPTNGKEKVTVTANFPGKDGMTILEYTGPNAGDETWRGAVTNTIYILGGAKRRGYVDKRDVAGMLAIRENGKNLFAVYTPPQPVVIAEPEPPPVEVEVKKEPEPEPTPEIEIWEPKEPVTIIDPGKKSVKKLEIILTGLTQVELEQVLEAEKSGKNRTGAIKAIEAELATRLV